MKIELELKSVIKNALKSFVTQRKLEFNETIDPIIERPKVSDHGDYATNIAMVLAGRLKLGPREIAENLKTIMEAKGGIVDRVEIAGPGFINFFLKTERYLDILKEVFDEGEGYGEIDYGRGKKIQVEFVSANPTGPLHVGHGRGAIYGDALSSILKRAGFDVTKEYYLNDTGNQMATLGKSVFLRIEELKGKDIEFPKECYQGGYIADIAREIKNSGKIDGLSNDRGMAYCGRYAGDKILEEIKKDLADCGVTHDTYFSETRLHEGGEVDKAMQTLRERGYAYESEGALWFKSTEFGDEKDRVLRKSTGEYTYFAADIAYHWDKFERGFDRVIDIWGADHGGHIKRMKGAVKALGYNPDNLDLILIQLVNLIRGGEMVSMSTRSATYEKLSSLVKDVGKDVCRYFFLMRSHNAQLDFDLELAREQSPENPVYYIQYAHARICSVFKKAKEEGHEFDPKKVDLKYLDFEEAWRLAKFLGSYPSVIKDCAVNLEPHKLSFYLLELARIFQSYYSKAKTDERYKVLFGDEAMVQAKLYLLKNIQIVLKNGLATLGIEAPEKMLREGVDD